MAYSFKQITIYAFDIHPVVSFLKDPSKTYFQPAFQFMGDKAQYQQIFLSGKPVQTTSFLFSGLPAQERAKSHWWKSYGDIDKKNGQPDIWHLQMPFVDRHFKTALTVSHDLPGVTISAFPSIYLSAIGWSVNLKIILRGDIKKADLVRFVGWLDRGNTPGLTFNLGKDKKEVFRYFTNLLLQEVYKKEEPPHGGMKIINQLLISLDSYEGAVTAYNGMASGEKALMRSILFGREIDPLQLATEERNAPLMHTQISTSGGNFSLTNFEKGTLIFLQREAKTEKPINREHKRKISCFAENCKNCTMMAYLLAEFYTKTAGATVTSDLGFLQGQLPQILKGIPLNYGNLYTRNLFAQHKGLSEIK